MAKSKQTLSQLAIELKLQNNEFIKAIGQSTKRLEEINRSTQKSAKSLNVLENGFKAIAVAFASFYAITKTFRGLEGLVKAEEQVVNLEASFNALTESADRGGDLLQRVFGIVESTGASFDTVATSVQRLAIGLTDLGASNEQIIKIAENFVKLGRVSGTSMADINGALIQFTQALASGRLQGDELRSISERLRPVIGLLADEMGVTAGEIKKLGSEGKITADILANALLKATTDVDEQFATLTFTTEQAFNVLQSEWLKTKAIISKSLGFGEEFSALYVGLTDLLKEFNKWVVSIRLGWEEIKLDILEFGQVWEEAMGWFSFSVMDTSGVDGLTKKIEEQKETIKELTEELEGFAKGLEAVNTEGFETIEILGDKLTAFETQVLKTYESFATLEEKLDSLNKLYKDGKITLEQYNLELEKASKVFKNIVVDADPLKEYNETIKELQLLLEKGIISFEQFANASADAMIILTKKTTVAMTEMEKQMQRLASDGVSDLVDVILEADKSFSDFAENFLRQIAKMIIQQQILNALRDTDIGGFFGFAKGGAFSQPTGLPQGVYNSPTFFPMPESNGLTAFAKGGTFGTGVMGEAGAEAIVPLRRGNNGDLGVQSSPVNVIVNNTMSESADVYAEATTKEDGSKQIEIMVERKVKESLGNGALDKSFSTNYGLKRRAM